MSTKSIGGQVNLRTSTDIQTSIGEITVYQHLVENEKTPVIFLHGLFLDHQLWDYQVHRIKDRSVYIVDMPLHGKSVKIKENWNLDDCAKMLLDILNKLEIQQVHAVGHSWGGMTILRAAEIQPNKFESLSFFNTPFHVNSKKDRRKIKIQHLGLLFKDLFIKKASQNIFARESLNNNPSLFEYFKSCMSRLSNKDIIYLNKVVRINAENKILALLDLKTKHQVIVGEKDLLAPAPPSGPVIYEEGGHTTPLEQPEESLNIILSILE